MVAGPFKARNEWFMRWLRRGATLDHPSTTRDHRAGSYRLIPKDTARRIRCRAGTSAAGFNRRSATVAGLRFTVPGLERPGYHRPAAPRLQDEWGDTDPQPGCGLRANAAPRLGITLHTTSSPSPVATVHASTECFSRHRWACPEWYEVSCKAVFVLGLAMLSRV